jgi:hypothetical protein
MKSRSIFTILALVLVCAGIYSSIIKASVNDNIAGWAWSNNVGWFKLNNCNNPGSASSCDTNAAYGMQIDIKNNTVRGYMWSNSVGWITFDPNALPSSCGGAACKGATISATINSDGSRNVDGWARACAVFASGCSGTLKPAASLGGWDGLVSLGDTNTSDSITWGLKVSSDRHLKGFMWGSESVSWVYIDVPFSTQCSDAKDNEDTEDTLADSADPGCHSDRNASNAASYDPMDDDESDARECSDGKDNSDPEDTVADTNDPGCHTDGNPLNAASYDSSDDNETNTSTQCSDGVDNTDPEDSLVDSFDPGCHTDGSASNVASYVPADDDETDGGAKAECSDGKDNSDPEDTLADSADPGCHTDGNASNAGTYNPNDTSEINSGGWKCSDGIDNDGDGKIDSSDGDCTSPTDDDEGGGGSACSDGIDNDGDGKIDFGQDAGCSSPSDNDEANAKPIFIER